MFRQVCWFWDAVETFGGSICININHLFHSSLRTVVLVFCQLDWSEPLGWDFVGDLGLKHVTLGDNKVLNCAWFHVLHGSIFNLTDLTVIFRIISKKHFWWSVQAILAFVLSQHEKEASFTSLFDKTRSPPPQNRSYTDKGKKVCAWQEGSGRWTDLRLLFLPPPHLISITSTSPLSCNCDSDLVVDSKENSTVRDF